MTQQTGTNNGQRLHEIIEQRAAPPVVQVSEKKQIVAAVESNVQLQQLLAQAATSPGQLLKMIKKCVGAAEAEIEIVEKVTYREG